MQPGRTGLRTVIACAVLCTSALAFAEDAKPTKIDVFPPDVSLKTLRDRQSLVVQATYPSGITRDVTSDAKFTLSNGKLCKFENQTLFPAADGATEVVIEYGGHSVKVPVKVEQAAADRPIMPVAAPPRGRRAGCPGSGSGPPLPGSACDSCGTAPARGSPACC